ncbi:MAG: hypothetical protein AB9919_11485 [Geobacteraceae bacterium]
MCKSLPCPLHGQNCWYCLNSAEGESVEVVSAAGTKAGSVCHAS